MDILELKRWPRLYAKIRYYQWFCIQNHDEYNKNAIYLSDAFDWETSEEGFNFWEYICEYEFDSAKQLYPNFFEEVWPEYTLPVKIEDDELPF